MATAEPIEVGLLEHTVPAQMSQTHVVILEAGVIGLTIAHVLTDNASFKVTIIAQDLPKDITSQGFASP